MKEATEQTGLDPSLEQKTEEFRECYSVLKEEIGKVFIGQPETVELLLTALFCGGHVLLEGVPGLGKTLLVKTLSSILHVKFSRIQCTPDLMPADIIGTNVMVDDTHGGQSLRFERGPLFANIVLADEINRATPKTQSAFLEAMQERQLTVFGVDHILEGPFFFFWCWRRRTRSRWREPIRCRKPSSIASSSNSRWATRAWTTCPGSWT